MLVLHFVTIKFQNRCTLEHREPLSFLIKFKIFDILLPIHSSSLEGQALTCFYPILQLTYIPYILLPYHVHFLSMYEYFSSIIGTSYISTCTSCIRIIFLPQKTALNMKKPICQLGIVIIIITPYTVLFSLFFFLDYFVALKNCRSLNRVGKILQH
jgi:hypothetical protein